MNNIEPNRCLLTKFAPPQINVAYSILSTPHKRAQYDRDRLEYLYEHFASHDSFPPTTTSTSPTDPNTGPGTLPSSSSTPNVITTNTALRDEQIQVYATTLTTRVRDPLEDKKTAIAARLARTRDELDDFNERSARHRQDWATSANRILRMAGNALREIVVCAEEDLCMLEDELGRLDGVLAPRDTDGPAGRVTSGQYGGSELGVGGVEVRGKAERSRYGVLAAANHRPPSVPRSPTVPVKPLSASRLGVQAESSSGKGGDSSGSEGAGEALAEIMADDRVHKFLLGPAHAARVQPLGVTAGAGEKLTAVTTTTGAAATVFARDSQRQNQRAAANQHRAPPKVFNRNFSRSDAASTIKKANNNSPSPSTLEKAFPPRPIGMGLVEWQALHGGLPETAAAERRGPNLPKVLEHEHDHDWSSSGHQQGHAHPVAAYDNDTDDVEGLGAPLPAKIQKRVDDILKRDFASSHQPSAGLWGEDFQIPIFTPLIPETADDNPHAHFTRKSKAAMAPTTNNLTPGAIGSGGGELGNMLSTKTAAGGHFGFHVSQPLERVVAMSPTDPATTTTTMQARSAGIKDFQVRVWSAAKAAKSGGEPRSGVELVTTSQEQLKEDENGDHHHAGAPDAAAPESGPAVLDTKISPSKGDVGASDASVFRRTKHSTAPGPASDELLKKDGSSTEVLDDPFR